MSAIEVTDGDEIVRAAYWQAWKEFQHFSPQTPDEKRSGPQRLQNEIRRLVESGARDPDQIAEKALGLLREAEQIARSKARVMSAPPNDDAASAS
jgi:hypothetical protein